MGPKAYDGSKRPNHMKDDATIEFTGDRRRFLQEHGPKIEEIFRSEQYPKFLGFSPVNRFTDKYRSQRVKGVLNVIF